MDERIHPAGQDGGGARVSLIGHTRTPVRNFDGLHVESWEAFDARADGDVPMLIDGLWGVGGIGFVAAPPKAGKTWLAIAAAISVASGRAFLDRFRVPTPRPVLYLAMEGSRHALRDRFQVVARGMGVDLGGIPIHVAYKPRGLNLSDPGWAAKLTAAADAIDAGLVIVDVLRRSTSIRESGDGAGDFAGLLRNLQGLELQGRALMLLHHFVKSSEGTRDRRPGELMAGSGALEGALDYALYISRADVSDRQGITSHALTVEHQARDIRSVPAFVAVLSGAASGRDGTWRTHDTVTCIADSTRPTTEVDVLIEQLRELLGRDPELTQDGAAALVGTTRHRKPFIAAWQRIHAEVTS